MTLAVEEPGTLDTKTPDATGEATTVSVGPLTSGTPHDRLMAVREAMNKALVGRRGEIDTLLRGVVAKEHVLLVGEPGTGKSLLCTSLGKAFVNADAFSVLLTKFSEPGELYGPVSVPGLQEGRYERLTAGYLPEAHVGFVDEVFKGSSAILNTLLTLMQERVFDNAGKRSRVPLRLLVGASNEWPNSDDEASLSAVFDRFLIRRTVQAVPPSQQPQLLFDDFPSVSELASLHDADTAAAEAAAIPVSAAARQAMLDMLSSLTREGIRPGDRRCRKAVRVAQAEAWLKGADEVLPAHLTCLSEVLWNVPGEQADTAAKIVFEHADPNAGKLLEVCSQVEELWKEFLAGEDLKSLDATALGDAKRLGALRKMQDAARQLAALGTEDGNEAAADVQKRLQDVNAVLTGGPLNISTGG